jgi:hypothetical protein
MLLNEPDALNSGRGMSLDFDRGILPAESVLRDKHFDIGRGA